MQPTIQDGRLILVNQWAYIFKKPRIRDIAVFRKDNKLFCKRITAVHTDGYCTMLGDNESDSLDSRELGKIRFDSILGKACVKER